MLTAVFGPKASRPYSLPLLLHDAALTWPPECKSKTCDNRQVDFVMNSPGLYKSGHTGMIFGTVLEFQYSIFTFAKVRKVYID